jgi:hypothetical protein
MNVDLWSSVELVDYADALRDSLAETGTIIAPRFLVPRHHYRTLQSTLGRAWLRILTYGAYPVLIAADFALRRRPEASIVTTNTFFAPWLAARLAARSRRVITLVYDLFPQVLVAAGKLPNTGVGARVIRAIMRDTFDRSTANVFLGSRLLEHAVTEFGPIPRTKVIPVGASSEPFADHPPRPRPAHVQPLVLYCGNLGWMHDIRTLVNACLMPADEPGLLPVTVRFHATGPRLHDMQRLLDLSPVGRSRSFSSDLTISVGAPLPHSEWTAAMLAADVGLITMIPGAEAAVMPSKAYSAMVAGQAILAVCPLDSDLADLVLSHDCGWVVVPDGGRSAASCRFPNAAVHHGPLGLREVFRRIASDRDTLQRKRMNAFQAGHRLFSTHSVARQWHALLAEITASPAAPDPVC